MSDGPSEDEGEGTAGGASSSPDPSLEQAEPPEEGAGETEIPLGVPVSAEEFARLKRAAEEHEPQEEEASEEPGRDADTSGPDSEDEG